MWCRDGKLYKLCNSNGIINTAYQSDYLSIILMLLGRKEYSKFPASMLTVIISNESDFLVSWSNTFWHWQGLEDIYATVDIRRTLPIICYLHWLQQHCIGPFSFFCYCAKSGLTATLVLNSWHLRKMKGHYLGTRQLHFSRYTKVTPWCFIQISLSSLPHLS